MTDMARFLSRGWWVPAGAPVWGIARLMTPDCAIRTGPSVNQFTQPQVFPEPPRNRAVGLARVGQHPFGPHPAHQDGGGIGVARDQVRDRAGPVEALLARGVTLACSLAAPGTKRPAGEWA